jgi:hypothetical protein
MAQAVSHQSLTTEAWVQSQANPGGIGGGQSGKTTGFPPSTSVFPSGSLHQPFIDHGCYIISTTDSIIK